MIESVEQFALFVALLFGLGFGWVLTLIGLPGNWLILGVAVLYAWLTPDTVRWDISLTLLGVLLAVAIVGEVIETAASAAGVRKLGGSRRGALLAVVGSVVGALTATGLVPIPIVGTLIGACGGALLGAVMGETWKGRDMDHVLRVGQAAAWGRLVGSFAKIVVASVMIALTIASAVLH